MSRFLPITVALGEIASRLDCMPTVEHYVEIVSRLCGNLLINPETGEIAVNDSGCIAQPIDFVTQELRYSLQYKRSPGAFVEAGQ